MREIKFRAWHKKLKRMAEPAYIDTDGDCYDIVRSWDGDIPQRDDSYILMHFTGLYDDTGREIYVGDIVEINGHKYSIVFEIGSFMLVRCSDKTDMYDQFKNCWNDDAYPLSQYHWENNCVEDVIRECEVIGNIYENSDLLAGKNQ